MRLRRFEYHEAGSLPDALDLVERYGEDARLLAGGTALLLMIRYGIVRPAHVVSLERIGDLRGVRRDGDVLLIGALTPLADVAASPVVREHARLLAAAAGRVATPAIRNMGTLGGNLCYAESASDPAPALQVLGARAVLESPRGRRAVPLADGFFRGFYETALEEGEILVEVEVPREPPGVSTYVKWSPRSLEDKALVGLAAVLDAEGGVCRDLRLAVGGVNPTPVRLPRAEAVARGQRLGDDLVAAVARTAAAEVDPIADVQASADYRREMVGVWLRRALGDLRSRVAAG